jgi:histidine triad (HIT) family protein
VSNCIFCEILAGREVASVIYQDEQALVILDLFPVSDAHALVLSRQHAGQLRELDPGVSPHLLMLAEKVMAAQRQLDPSIEAHNLLINDGKTANQHVPHVHLHVIPRRRGDGVMALANWSTRFLRRFNMAARRQRLDRLAAALRDQLRTD